MTFRPHPFEDLDPVRPDEIVAPTRVVWRRDSGMLASRIFPTVERAHAFRAGLEPRTEPLVQPASEAPPEQTSKRRIPRGLPITLVRARAIGWGSRMKR